jgi:hypothetical protein
MSDNQFHPAWPQPANSASDIQGPKKHDPSYDVPIQMSSITATATTPGYLPHLPSVFPMSTAQVSAMVSEREKELDAATAKDEDATPTVFVPLPSGYEPKTVDFPWTQTQYPTVVLTNDEISEAYDKVRQVATEQTLEKAETTIERIRASQTATTGGRKFDGGKPQYGLLPVYALEENVKVLTVGAQKYEPDNWKRVPDGPRRYFDAALRHLFAFKRGETNDPETGLHHLAHALCCIQFILDLELAEKASQVPPKPAD